MPERIHDNYLNVLIIGSTMAQYNVSTRTRPPMHIAILTFEGFNELDSLIALGILNRVKQPGWRVSIASPADKVRSMNGVVMEAQASLKDACDADAGLAGGGGTSRGRG